MPRVLCRERFWVDVDMKRRYRNGLNEWMNQINFFWLSDYVLRLHFHDFEIWPSMVLYNWMEFQDQKVKIKINGQNQDKPAIHVAQPNAVLVRRFCVMTFSIDFDLLIFSDSGNRWKNNPREQQLVDLWSYWFLSFDPKITLHCVRFLSYS